MDILQSFKEDSIIALRKLLPIGSKTIIFDPATVDIINLIVSTTTLKSWNVVKFHVIENDPVITTKHVIFILKPSIKVCQQVASIISKYKRLYHIIFLPNKNIQCERVFEAEGVWSFITISVLPITFLPAKCGSSIPNHGILSMENDLLKKVIIDYNNLPLLQSVDAIIKIQGKYGKLPIIQGIGYFSLFITEELLKQSQHLNNPLPSKIGRLILIDRQCDLITPLLSPITYGGMVNKNDIVYDTLKDLNIYHVGEVLNHKLTLSNKVYKDYDDKDFNKIKDFVFTEKQYPQKLLIKHHALIKNIIDKIKISNTLDLEQNLLLGVADFKLLLDLPPLEMTRLLCLYYLTSNKHLLTLTKQINYDTFVEQMINHYGPTFLFEHLKAILPQRDHWDWSKIQKDFSLLPVNTENDISTVLEGYAPLSCRLVEMALLTPFHKFTKAKQNDIYQSWGENNKRIKKLKMPHFHLVQETEFESMSDNQLEELSSTIMVMFIGGITYNEISCLNYLQTLNPNNQIIIASTSIITDFIKTLS